MHTNEMQVHHWQGRARHSVRAVIGDRATGGQRTARPTKKSVSIRVYPW